jgi:cephalosporin hydroxylase
MEYSDIFHEHGRLVPKDWEIITNTAYGFYVELGTFHGASACAAAQHADRVLTADIYDWQPKVFNSDKITFFKGTSIDLAEQIKRWDLGPIDVLFIDGSHEYDSVKKDCEALVPLVKSGGIVMFHDHNKNNLHTGVYRAVNEYVETIEYEDLGKDPQSSNLFKIRKL